MSRSAAPVTKKSPANLTKYCACHAKWPSNLAKYCTCHTKSMSSITLRNYYFTNLWLYESITLRIYYFTDVFLYESITLRIHYFTNWLLYESMTLRIYYFTNLFLWAFLKVRNSEVSHPNFLWWIQVMSSIMAIIFNLRYDSTKKAPQKRRTECQRLHNSLRACHVTYFQSNQVSWVAAACFCILHDARMSRHLGSKAETRPTGHYPGLLMLHLSSYSKLLLI